MLYIKIIKTNRIKYEKIIKKIIKKQKHKIQIPQKYKRKCNKLINDKICNQAHDNDMILNKI